MVVKAMLPLVPPQVVGLVTVPAIRPGDEVTDTLTEPVIVTAEQLVTLASTV